MKWLLKSVVATAVLFTWFGLTVGQQMIPSIHQIEHAQHRGQRFQEEVPGLPRAAVPFMPRDTALTREVFGFHPYWMGTVWQNYQFSLLTTIAYFGADISATGDMVEAHGWPVNSLINEAHRNGVRVVLTAILFTSSDITTLLSSSTNRNHLIQNLVTSVENAGADGVNVDFEGVSGTQRSNLTLFLSDLTEEFHTRIPDSRVTIDVPAVDWADAFDYSTLADVCDGLMIMGYDYHWSQAPTTGPVSPLTGWGTYNLTWTVNDYLDKTGDAGEKLILGLPYYGYQWTAESGEPGASVVGTGEAKTYVQAEGLAESFGKLRSEEGGQIPWYRYSENSAWQQGWYDDSLSLSLKYDFANQLGLQGVGIWALGYDGDRTELWDALAGYLEMEAAPPDTITPPDTTAPGLRLATYPNPFQESLIIQYQVPENFNSPVSLAIYNVTGKKMVSFFDNNYVLASGTVRWDGRTRDGEPAASGVYLIVGRDYFHTETMKITLLR